MALPSARIKTKPDPFRRPAIEIGGHGKVWADIPIYSLEPGDMVKGHGAVEATWQAEDFVSRKVKRKIRYFSGVEVVYEDSTLLINAFIHRSRIE